MIKTMQIVILGAGKTGSYVASVLSEEGHNVVLIDKDAKVLEKASRESDIATLHATIPDWQLFEDLLENSPHLFFAATGDDETNLVACSVAKNLGFPKTIARVKSRSYLNHSRLDFNRLFFADYFIGAELLAAQDLFQLLIHSADSAAEHFAHGEIEMRTLPIPERWDQGGTCIRDLKLPNDLIVGLIRRKMAEGEKILFPHGEDHILPGDEVTFVGEAGVMHRLHEVFGFMQRRIRSIVIVGGTAVAENLAYALASQKISVRIFDTDEKRCDELAERLPLATLINRDGSDPKVLLAERIQDADAMLSCTHRDGTNFLIAALAKELSCKKAIALISDSSYANLLEKAGVMPVLSVQVKVANRILSILHEETILSVSSLSQDQAKIVELKVPPSSPLIGIPLSDLKLPKDLLIAVIESRGRVMVGRGNRILSPDDTVIVICHPQRIPQLPSYFH
jgi:trk/ktr system potassium uptake protein